VQLYALRSGKRGTKSFGRDGAHRCGSTITESYRGHKPHALKEGGTKRECQRLNISVRWPGNFKCTQGSDGRGRGGREPAKDKWAADNWEGLAISNWKAAPSGVRVKGADKKT